MLVEKGSGGAGRIRGGWFPHFTKHSSMKAQGMYRNRFLFVTAARRYSRTWMYPCTSCCCFGLERCHKDSCCGYLSRTSMTNRGGPAFVHCHGTGCVAFFVSLYRVICRTHIVAIDHPPAGFSAGSCNVSRHDLMDL